MSGLSRLYLDKKLFLILLAFFIFLPHLFSGPDFKGDGIIGLPRVYSGDEPHYMIILSSLLNDGDFEVSNNYQNAREGGWDAGKRKRWVRMDHHTYWYVGTKPIRWMNVYEWKGEWDRNGDGYYVQTLRKDKKIPQEWIPKYQYSQHPIWMAVLTAPLLIPFRNSHLLEPFAIILCGVIVFLVAILLLQLFSYFRLKAFETNTSVLFLICGTPLWHYGRALYTEIYITLFLLVAYLFHLKGRAPCWVGIALGFVTLLKPPLIAVSGPILLDLAIKKEWKKFAVIGLCLAVSVIIYLTTNYFFQGGVFRTAQPWITTPDILYGFTRFWTNPRMNFVTTSPVILLAILGFIHFWKTYRREMLLFLGVFLTFYVIFALFLGEGAWYGPRYFVPAMPFMIAPVAFWLTYIRNKQNVWLTGGTYTIGCVSILINAYYTLPYWKKFTDDSFLIFFD